MLIALIHIRLARRSRSIDHSFVPTGCKLAHLEPSLPKVHNGLLYNTGGHEHPGERASAELQRKCDIAILRCDERDRLPTKTGKSCRPWRNIKDRQTCLCDHVVSAPLVSAPQHFR